MNETKAWQRATTPNDDDAMSDDELKERPRLWLLDTPEVIVLQYGGIPSMR